MLGDIIIEKIKSVSCGLEIHSVMLVFSTQLCPLTLSLVQLSPPLPPSLCEKVCL
jgi:hypothetical protein